MLVCVSLLLKSQNSKQKMKREDTIKNTELKTLTLRQSLPVYETPFGKVLVFCRRTVNDLKSIAKKPVSSATSRTKDALVSPGIVKKSQIYRKAGGFENLGTWMH